MGLFRLFARSPRRLVRAFALFRHPAVPLSLKLLAIAGVIAIISPFDLLGDIPVLGFFDDAALLALLLAWFVRAASRYGEEISAYGDEISKQTLMVSRASIAR